MIYSILLFKNREKLRFALAGSWNKALITAIVGDDSVFKVKAQIKAGASQFVKSFRNWTLCLSEPEYWTSYTTSLEMLSVG
ncbi:hypothetical protein OJAV_G00052120 [Oryzias javanicus]|uniref:Uncharacterized protein n=1 Tax=Oryzias javanicus TaxID=123683 RepID=A0A3S2N1L5_ORYJA|nr:hypothetical protein OJAV_G00052120 [Oryzias javanicus]